MCDDASCIPLENGRTHCWVEDFKPLVTSWPSDVDGNDDDDECSSIFVFRSDFGKLNSLAAISTISLTLRLVRDSSIVSLLSSSLSSSLLRFEYRFAPLDAGLLGVDGMLRIRSRMAHRSSMTANLDTTSSLSVDVPHVVIIVFDDVVLDKSRDVDVR